MKTPALTALTLMLALAACESQRTHVTRTDARGNHITTSQFQAMERVEFEVAMRAGLRDFEERVVDLRSRANELGGEALSDFAEWEGELEAKKVAFVNQMKRSEAVLVDDWPDQRAEVVECYQEMRECLDEAYDAVLDT